MPTGKIAFAEGPETALSVAEAHPDWTVYVTFGVSNFEKVPLKTKAKSIVICADNDGINSGTAKSVAKIAKALSDKGIDVWVAEPQKPDDINKWDFNDSLTKHGIEEVKKELDSAILVKAGITQESVAKEIKESLSALEKSTVEFNAATATQKSIDNEISNEEKIDPTIIKEISVEALLSQYVDMELKQDRLVDAMYMAKLKDPKNSHEFSARAVSHLTSMQAFAAEVANRPDIKAEIEKLNEIRPMTLSERGGFIAIKDRITKGELSKDDINVLLV